MRVLNTRHAEGPWRLDGMVCLRRPELVVRFDPKTWREVPWDYGEERKDTFVTAARR